MGQIRCILLLFLVAVPTLASAEVMNFEQAAATLGASCGKDIDDNCRGVNLDPSRLKECFLRNGDSISAQCRTDYPTRLQRHRAAAFRARYPFKALQLRTKSFLRRGPAGYRQGSSVPAGFEKEYAELQQGDRRDGVPLMRFSAKRCGLGMLAAASVAFVLPSLPVRAQTAAPAPNLVDQLIGPETPADIDVPALRQQVADRVKSKADATALKRRPIAPQLLKLPRYNFEVAFDPDSALIRPQSYQTIGRIADALADPKLLPYTFLVVDHTESTGRRDANLILSQRRAELDPRSSGRSVQDFAEAPSGAWPRRGAVAGFFPSGIANQWQSPDHDGWGSRCRGSNSAGA